MDKSTHAVRLEQWTKLVQSCADSGLTKKEWCSQNNIKLKTYFYWQRRVRNHALMVKAAASSDPDTAFAELRLQGAVPADSSVSEDAVSTRLSCRCRYPQQYLDNRIIEYGV
jgi:hypothetical protein